VKQTTVGGTPTSVDYPFNFSGDLSYNPGGAFTLNTVNAQSSQMEFVRAAESSPWSVTEDADPNWVLTSATARRPAAALPRPLRRRRAAVAACPSPLSPATPSRARS